MVSTRFAPCPPDHTLVAGFDRIRADLEVPDSFPPAVEREADEVSRRGPELPPDADDRERVDHRGIELVSIDPPGSRDIDQAFSATRTKRGYLVHYAIADLGSFVAPGGAIDRESRERGVTLYSPDERASLHPDAINHGIASLLPGEDRAALMWSIDIDHDGAILAARIERSLVRNREAITYREAQTRLARPDAPETLRLLREIGRLREEQERIRHAVSLRLPAQEITATDDTYELTYDESLPIEGWNAQISLLTGIAAAAIMIEGGTGLLRTLPRPPRDTIAELRAIARGLHIGWDSQVGYAERVRELDPTIPNEAALLSAAARGLRGAGYLAFHDGGLPSRPEHSAIASTYAHVTAPLRRVCDRFANEILLAQVADRRPPSWAVEALDELPEIMGRARNRDGRLERALLDYLEATTLAGREGAVLDAVVTGRRDDAAVVQVLEPAVIAPIDDDTLPLGERIRVQVLAVDVDAGRVVLDRARSADGE
ncbi:MAG: RNB domain-containing ribonuclease [Acidimicrobiia bacterium]|nr:RNB domain-containing ribonuclease [Acidimicrobiia bacterium]